MFKNVAKCLIITVFSFGLNLATASEPRSFSIPRENGSLLEGYILPPENNSFPILFAIQGSGCASTHDWFLELRDYVKPLGLGLVILEKQGVSKDAINKYEYNQTNSLDHRVHDHELCIRNLNDNKYTEWNGEIVFLGESEGGMIASELASTIPNVKALMLFAAGGGMRVKDEIKWVLQTKLVKHGASQEEIDDFMAILDDKMNEMINNPTPDKFYLGNTHKWWASFLTSKNILSNLQNVNSKIFFIHGNEDDNVPVQSADMIVQELSKSGERDITYQKLGRYGHNLNHPAIMQNVFAWLESVIDETSQRSGSFRQEISFSGDLASNMIDEQRSILNLESEFSEYHFTRQSVVSGKSSKEKDDEGNESRISEISAEVRGDRVRAEATARHKEDRDRDGRTITEDSVEFSVGFDFRDR